MTDVVCDYCGDVCVSYCEECDGVLPSRRGCGMLLTAIVLSWVVVGTSIVGAVTILRWLFGKS